MSIEAALIAVFFRMGNMCWAARPDMKQPRVLTHNLSLRKSMPATAQIEAYCLFTDRIERLFLEACKRWRNQTQEACHDTDSDSECVSWNSEAAIEECPRHDWIKRGALIRFWESDPELSKAFTALQPAKRVTFDESCNPVISIVRRSGWEKFMLGQLRDRGKKCDCLIKGSWCADCGVRKFDTWLCRVELMFILPCNKLLDKCSHTPQRQESGTGESGRDLPPHLSNISSIVID